MDTQQLLSLARKYRDAPGLVTVEEYEELRDADLVNGAGQLNVAGTDLEEWLDEFPYRDFGQPGF